jgi:very-short-patch-repair endonuclease
MLKDDAPKATRRSLHAARRLRRTMTPPEIALWQILRHRPHGLKFRRQHPSGDYVLDFYCGDARLGIEIDGGFHDRGDAPTRDQRRDTWFAERGIATVRVTAADVLRDVDAVSRHVVEMARARLPLHHPAAPGGPPPRDELGEE